MFNVALTTLFAQPADQPHGHIDALQASDLAGRLVMVADRLPGLHQAVELIPCLADQHFAQAISEVRAKCWSNPIGDVSLR